MSDFAQGIKRDVSEVKFLIHDLRVERFIDEVIHFHVSLDTDLQLYGLADFLAGTSDYLPQLRARAVRLHTALETYHTMVRGLAPPEDILAAGNDYLSSIHELCELILDPMWGHIDEALSLLPDESRSVHSRSHYRNTIRWLCGVYYRIERFWAEQRHEEVKEVFDLSADLEDCVRNVIYGYVTERSAARVEMHLGRLDQAVLHGNRYRFRRMFFNLVMNAVDAMRDKRVGELVIEVESQDDRATLTVRDNGSGMTREKIDQLLTDRETLDGELHSLGFVFVRQTVAEFGGELVISSEPGVGTTVQVVVPTLPGIEPPPRHHSLCEQFDLPRSDSHTEHVERRASTERVRMQQGSEAGLGDYGHTVLSDYQRSDSDHPGCIFALAIAEDERVEVFAHKPYERFWNIGHEDLLPMFFEATVRGRLEEDDDKNLVLILKSPQNTREYFDLKEVADEQRTAQEYVRMVRDELIRVARRLIETGLPEAIDVQVAAISKFLPEVANQEPFPVSILAGQRLSSEG